MESEDKLPVVVLDIMVLVNFCILGICACLGQASCINNHHYVPMADILILLSLIVIVANVVRKPVPIIGFVYCTSLY